MQVEDKVAVGIVLMWVFACLAINVGIFYVVLHFILKFW
jgi:hypothetical protein